MRTTARMSHMVKRDGRFVTARGHSEIGRFCCKSRKIEGVKNRRQSRRNKKALFKGIVARLEKSLVV